MMRIVFLFIALSNSQVAYAADEDAGELDSDAGKLTYPGRGEANKHLIDEYTSDHGCSCQALGSTHALHGWVSVLALAGAVGVRRRAGRFLSRK